MIRSSHWSRLSPPRPFWPPHKQSNPAFNPD
jgi:hypothetical protein